jgi:hypothetical protein
MSTIPRLRQINVVGAEYVVGGGAILAGQAPVHGRPLPVILGVAPAGVGKLLVEPCRTVMRGGRVQAHHRRPPGRRKSAQVRRPGQGFRLRYLIRSRAEGSAVREAGSTGTGGQQGVPLMQVADSRVEFGGSPPPAERVTTCRASAFHTCRASAFHLLVVSHRDGIH